MQAQGQRPAARLQDTELQPIRRHGAGHHRLVMPNSIGESQIDPQLPVEHTPCSAGDPHKTPATAAAVRVPLVELAIANGLFQGLAGVVKTLAGELGPAGIRVNALLPVRIATNRVRKFGKFLQGDPDEVRARLSEHIPLRRYGEPEEFGRAAAFVLSPAASYITGAMIPVDGGAISSI